MKHSITILLCLTAIALSIVPRSHAQEGDWTYTSPTWSPKLRVNQIESSNYPEITIYASATYAGRPMDGLSKSDFRVREDGVDQPIIEVSARRDPISVVLLLDVSGSMKGSLPAAQDAAAEFIRTLSPNDQVEVMTFHERIDTIYPLGNNFREAERAIRQTRPLGDTALYDGVNEALSALYKHRGRRAVVVLSDGVDDDGTGNQLSKNDVDIPILRALTSNVPIYTIGLGTNMDEGVLRAISSSTGADYISSPTAGQLLSLYRELGQVLAGQYAVRYRSTSFADGSVRGIKLDYVIPGSKPFASPEAVLEDGHVLGYRSPKLTREQNSHLARLAGLPELQRRYNLPKFKSIDIHPQSAWPKWLPDTGRVLTVTGTTKEHGVEVFEFTTQDSEILVTEGIADSMRQKGWEIKTKTSVANMSTVEMFTENESLTVGAIREGGRTKVTAEYKGESGPIFVGNSRQDQIFATEGRDVVISSSYSKIRMVGHCPNLTISGEGNEVVVDSADVVRLSGSGNALKIEQVGSTIFYGDKNRVQWKKGDGKTVPDFTDKGIDNRFDKIN